MIFIVMYCLGLVFNSGLRMAILDSLRANCVGL